MISDDHWAGSLNDLIRLAKIIESQVATEAKEFYIAEDYSPKSTFKIQVIVESDDFDPPMADLELFPGK